MQTNDEMPLAVKIILAIAWTGALFILGTFFYPPSLEVYLGWADYVMGVHR